MRKIKDSTRKYMTSLALLFAILTLFLAGCEKAADAPKDRYHIVTTVFPAYDWTREILGENPGDIEITMLLDGGTDLHSFQPTAKDIVTLSSCDMFIYVGGESEEWVEAALREVANPDMKVISLLEVLGEGAKEEEIVEGMEADHDHDAEDHDQDHDAETEGHDHDHDASHHHDEEGMPQYDEHVWLSLRNASLFTDTIALSLGEMDAENAEIYRNNGGAYKEKLSALDEEYTRAAEAGTAEALLFGDRFPFRYLTDDYSIKYYAAFAGCSAETEASFETVAFLANKVNELGLKTILIIDGSDGKLANTIADTSANSEVKVLSVNSMQSVTSADVQEGVTYLSIMKDNLTIFEEALGE